MSADSKKNEEEVFSLPAPERAHLAMSLIESLDNQEDANDEALWLEEEMNDAALFFYKSLPGLRQRLSVGIVKRIDETFRRFCLMN